MKLQLNHNRLEVLSHKNDQEKERTAADNDRRSTAFRCLPYLLLLYTCTQNLNSYCRTKTFVSNFFRNFLPFRTANVYHSLMCVLNDAPNLISNFLSLSSLCPHHLSPHCRVFDALRGRPQHQAASPEPTSSEAADTQPRELPAELWSSSLQSLYLHSNRLKWLPGYLGKLGALTRLDISR